MYQLIAPIQSGSFSTVYSANKIDDNNPANVQKVALKVLPRTKTERTTVEQECYAMNKVNKHPNICHFLDCYEDKNWDSYVMVLEYCSEGDMHDLIYSNKLKLSKQLNNDRFSNPISSVPPILPSPALSFYSITKQLCSAINYSHSKGVAHRDIKPENILLNNDGMVKLGDWGHATINKYSTECNVGTDAYRAPETFYSSPAYNTKQSDFWGLGSTLIYFLLGEPIFRCLQNNNTKKNPKSTNEKSSKVSILNDELLLKVITIYQGKFLRNPTFQWNDIPYSKNNSKLISLIAIILETLLVIKPENRSIYVFEELLDDLFIEDLMVSDDDDEEEVDFVQQLESHVIISHTLNTTCMSLNNMPITPTSPITPIMSNQSPVPNYTPASSIQSTPRYAKNIQVQNDEKDYYEYKNQQQQQQQQQHHHHHHHHLSFSKEKSLLEDYAFKTTEVTTTHTSLVSDSENNLINEESDSSQTTSHSSSHSSGLSNFFNAFGIRRTQSII
ncbi:hypothetical protein TBLA_0D02070 [Henningerozyma blattae CBS 6284]|uniref:non-specific serine/threonine protein kinase n=1 Tax=Henningerozyma blattae (strain ATCC 34711 / CBS 6284 / DSM 70876 / NBRC 10599 / NRRL Y-10934 / UCD 77-7) TaxID=1071380 RepID=I2H2W2_HENB6|nr:hypothetical protein TBLA_0D02070 [Tetrapisispora blattae CBS 6284]CCH60714.1 hypothetical protein TBLA_0D02070 [Tetrapisispora blattae CBS 6284]